MNAKAYLKKVKVYLPTGKESNLYDEIKRAPNDQLRDEILKLLDAVKERVVQTEDHTTLLNTYAALVSMNLPKNYALKVTDDKEPK